ncbi:hypothetical protein BT63DRAFT_400621 [Microthyrium microscopicum]|uniref:ARID domain-containing protein n=1 Tax=Microthyrium microscopicum TaxID=703497 RepID=A0A6A6UFH5_9PEZI|nr:hypothetical protein BT63DRAFT_400621 [Microthyrium microscopicum]
MAPREDEVAENGSNDESDKFLEELAAFHEKRGTLFEPRPKVGPRYIDLLKLYKRVVEEGGYDKVSDTRGNKLAWRRISADFLPSNSHIVQLAFQVKTVYYKFLSAYEITHIHKKEPPPKEILEDLTAKGGDLLNRTLENYHRRALPEVEKLANGIETESDGDEHDTPKADKMDVDPPSTGGRVTRAGLRQAPPQRVLFGQDGDGSRQSRSGGVDSPTPGNGINGTYSSSAASATIANYDPRPIAPSLVKPVATPANSSIHFRELSKRHKATLRRNKGISFAKGMMFPGTGFTGPNIYMRCVRALESGIQDEVKYALHHLVKISFERGDKFLFSQFTNLADELIHAVCNVSTAWYEHPGWEYSWTFAASNQPHVLMELSGTSNLIEKIQSFPAVDISSVHPDTFNNIVNNASQACLVIRNMVVLEDNARYLSEMPVIRDMMTIIFQLPRRAETVEVKYYALEIAELLTKYWVLDGNDDFYLSLLDMVDQNSTDRGMIITGLRTLSRISMLLEAPNRLENAPIGLITKVYHWLLVEDEELRTACLDLLYQYTAITENVNHLVKAMDTESMVDTLMTFVMSGAIRIGINSETAKEPEVEHIPVSSAPADELPKLAPSVIQKLCQISDPKDQSSSWLRTCFVEDPNGEITQLALWSAYNEAFSNAPSDNVLMVAKDFITNVTNVFPKAVARVVPHEQDRNRSKYTMKGISPRAVPIDLRERALARCRWRLPVRQSTENANQMQISGGLHKDCDIWFSPTNPEEMWTHIVEKHLEIPRDPDNPRRFKDGLVKGTGRKFACLWTGCTRFPSPGIEDAHKVSMHVKVHLPDTDTTGGAIRKHSKAIHKSDHSGSIPRYYRNTPVDEQGNPVGLSLSALLVLRNLARQMLKIESNDMRGRQNLIERHFALHQQKIADVVTFNWSLRHYTPEFMQYVSKGMEMAHKLPRLSNGSNE